MKKSTALNNAFSILIGAFFIVDGIWGLFSDVTFGVLTTNMAHAVIHILLGIAGIALGIKQNALGFCIFLGVLLAVVGIARFVPGVDMLLVQLLNVNKPVACLNIVIALVAFIVSSRKKGDVKA